MNVEQIRSDPDYAEAVCPVNRLCRYDTLFSNDVVHKEICRFCHKEKLWPRLRGQVNKLAYGRAHIRDMLQIGMRAYDEIYGRSHVDRTRKENKMLAKKWSEEDYFIHALDAAKTYDRLEAQGKL